MQDHGISVFYNVELLRRHPPQLTRSNRSSSLCPTYARRLSREQAGTFERRAFAKGESSTEKIPRARSCTRNPNFRRIREASPNPPPASFHFTFPRDIPEECGKKNEGAHLFTGSPPTPSGLLDSPDFFILDQPVANNRSHSNMIPDERAGTEAHVKSQSSGRIADPAENRLSTMGPRDPLGFCRALWRRAYLKLSSNRGGGGKTDDADASVTAHLRALLLVFRDVLPSEFALCFNIALVSQT
ncbi:hypothetical protein DBV15_08865 [Temnothorax longispinosus]|uniref:Uncharacterized protein n=1 Tax=Temnothorax longispinosus TaxID=300112 RepID=A0A4S2KSL7_9HYME|nr:hypothetical protein DBV15_08865 [Temnothorax longispinosus]